MLDLEKFVFDRNMDPGRMAVMLAMTQNQASEKEIISQYRAMGVRSAVTMISGNDVVARPKILRSIIGLCLNEGIVEKKTEQLHPLAHAVWEASQCSRVTDAAISQNFCVKASVVRKGSWIAVCLYGNMGMHELTTHTTVGLGIQILGE